MYDEAAENWLTAQNKIKAKNEACFLKTHNVFGAYKLEIILLHLNFH